MNDNGAKRRWTWGLTFVAAGVTLTAIGLIIGMNRYGPSAQYTLSEANAICSSAFGQVAQVTSVRAHANCASVANSEEARGWLLVIGIIAIAAGAAWDFCLRRWRGSAQVMSSRVG